MLGLLIWAIIVGAIAAGLTGISVLFWVVSIAIFVCVLPFALISDFIYDKIDYAQDREDYREEIRQIAEDERMDRYLSKLDDYKDDFNSLDDYGYRSKPTNVYIDNRQVHYHNYSSDRPRDSHGRFISSKK
jgi:hypothetical protein